VLEFRRFRNLTAACAVLFSALLAHAAAPITGTVINKTNGKPSAGDDVVLIQLQQAMQESTRTTTDAHGRFTLQVPDDGMHLVRVTHQKANYFQPVQPGSTAPVEVTVYDAAPQIEGVSTGVEELHVEASPNELHIVEVLQVLNNSAPPRTQFGPSGYEFYLPEGALIGRTGAITQGGMPVQTPAVPRGDPGHFSFLFPIRPGETQFGIGYTLPYTGKFTFTPRLTAPVKTFAVLVPESMTLMPTGHVALTLQSGKPGQKTYLAQDVTPDNPPSFSIAGTGTLPDQSAGADTGANGSAPNAATANPGSNPDASAPPVSNSDLAGGRGLNNPLNESGDRDPWAKYKWWILAGLALLLAAAAGVLLRKPAADSPEATGTAAPLPTWPPAPIARPSSPASTHEGLLQALKEELFALETEHLQRRISEPEYAEARAALDLILRRTLRRSEAPSAGVQAGSSAALASVDASPEPALTGEPRG
jgi:5-hydroxyisourate hydrolase-like protein (transthyretin family)